MKRLRRAWLLAGLLLVFLISGCAVHQERDVQIYRQVLDAGKSGPAAQFHPEDPLTLKAALGLANTHNEQLAMAGENYLQALIDKNRAFAAFLPTISFAPAFMRRGETVPGSTTVMPVAGNMDLHPFRDLPALQAAGSTAQRQRALLLDHQAVLMLDVAKTYFQVMRAEKQVEVLRYSIKVGRQRLTDIRVKQKAGVARPVDAALAEAQLAKTRGSLVGAKDDVHNGRAMLAFLIGVAAVNGPLTNGLNVPPMDWRAEPLLKLADAHRQDLIAAHEQVKIAAAMLEAAWGEYFPSVSLNLTHYLSGGTSPGDVDWTSLIRINVPIFSAGLIHQDVRTAYSRLRQARFAELHVRRQVVKDLRVAVDNLRSDSQQICQLGIEVKAAREGTRQADAGFDAGLGTNLERLVAEDGLLAAKLTLSTARFNQNVDYMRLLRVTGALNPALAVTLPSAKNNFDGLVKRSN